MAVLWRENQLFDRPGYGGDDSGATYLEHLGPLRSVEIWGKEPVRDNVFK